jgi:hypothetical protein
LLGKIFSKKKSRYFQWHAPAYSYLNRTML